MTVNLKRIRKGEKLPWEIEDIEAESFPPEVRMPHGLKQKLNNNGDLETFLVQRDGRTIGFVCMTWYRKTAYIVFMVIEKRWQYQGIGSYVLKLLKGIYSDKVIGLECTEDLVGFYRRNGFADTGYTTEYAGMHSIIMFDGEMNGHDMETIRRRFEAY